MSQNTPLHQATRNANTHVHWEHLLHRATRNENTHVLPSYTGRRGMRTYMSSKHHTSLCRESWAAASVSFIFRTLQKETSTSLTVESCFLFTGKVRQRQAIILVCTLLDSFASSYRAHKMQACQLMGLCCGGECALRRRIQDAVVSEVCNNKL